MAVCVRSVFCQGDDTSYGQARSVSAEMMRAASGLRIIVAKET